MFEAVTSFRKDRNPDGPGKCGTTFFLCGRPEERGLAKPESVEPIVDVQCFRFWKKKIGGISGASFGRGKIVLTRVTITKRAAKSVVESTQTQVLSVLADAVCGDKARVCMRGVNAQQIFLRSDTHIVSGLGLQPNGRKVKGLVRMRSAQLFGRCSRPNTK